VLDDSLAFFFLLRCHQVMVALWINRRFNRRSIAVDSIHYSLRSITLVSLSHPAGSQHRPRRNTMVRVCQVLFSLLRGLSKQPLFSLDDSDAKLALASR
jgi:hypothetical protein